MRRLPPNKIEQNLNGLLNLIPEETDELLQRIDQPLKEETCPDTVSIPRISCLSNHAIDSSCEFYSTGKKILNL